jgi:pimeloyl-ACP methyl ester carboxylesterase
VGALHGELTGVAVISCHGMLSDKRGAKHVRLAEELERQGVATLRFDFAGRGESQGELFEMTFSHEVEDVDAAITELCRQGVTRVGLFGSSMGGAVALLTAARDERVVAVATLAAVAHPEALDELWPDYVQQWRERGYVETEAGRIGQAFADDALEQNVIAAARVLRAPVLVVHGTEDTVVPSSDAVDIASAARKAQLELVDGADHRFSNPVHLRPAMDKVASFLARALRGEDPF